MLMHKKALSILLAVLILSFAALSGCGGKTAGGTEKQESTVPKDTSAGTEKQESTVQESTVPKDTYEISWYMVAGGQPKDTALVEAEAEKYLKDKINIKLKFIVVPWGEWGTKMNAMIAASEKFDIIFTAHWWGYYEQVAKGALHPLNDLMDKYAPKTKELLGEMFIKGTQVDGVNYAVPVKKEIARTEGFFFNKALMDKYNFDLNSIRKPEDIEPWLKVIKENEPDIIPYGTGGLLLVDMLQFDTLAGSVEVPGAVLAAGKDTKVVNQFATPEYKQLLDLTHKWFKAGYIDKDAATNAAKINELEKQGKVFCKQTGLKPGADAEYSNDKVTWVQKQITPIVTTNLETNGAMNAISRTSENPERAMMFLEIVNTDKYMNNLLNFGIENIHYKKVSDNIIEEIPDNRYGLDMPWAVGNQFLNYLKSNENPKKWELFEEFNSKSVPSPALGFRFNMEPYMAQISAMKNIYQEYIQTLRFGAVNPDEYLPKALQKQKDAGSEELLKAIQAELDAWLAKR